MVKEFLTIRIDEQAFAIDVKYVRDVSESQEIYPVPLAGNEILGSMNIHGAIITILDIRKLLDLKEKNHSTPGVIVVIEYEKELVGFIVDKVGDIINDVQSEITKEYNGLDPAWHKISGGVFRLDSANNGELVVILELNRLIGNLF